jgi:hypothetical protein
MFRLLASLRLTIILLIAILLILVVGTLIDSAQFWGSTPPISWPPSWTGSRGAGFGWGS